MVLLISLPEGQPASGAGIAERDTYGGWPGLKFEKTGFFHLAKDSAGRWWMVSPEGNAYLAAQMDHMEVRILQGDYNRAFWAQKFGIPSNAPNADWLPGYHAKVRQDMKAIGFNAVHGVRVPGLPYIKSFTNINSSTSQPLPSQRSGRKATRTR